MVRWREGAMKYLKQEDMGAGVEGMKWENKNYSVRDFNCCQTTTSVNSGNSSPQTLEKSRECYRRLPLIALVYFYPYLLSLSSLGHKEWTLALTSCVILGKPFQLLSEDKTSEQHPLKGDLSPNLIAQCSHPTTFRTKHLKNLGSFKIKDIWICI